MADFLYIQNNKLIKPISGSGYVVDAENVKYDENNNVKNIILNKAVNGHNHDSEYFKSLSISAPTNMGATGVAITKLTSTSANGNQTITATTKQFLTNISATGVGFINDISVDGSTIKVKKSGDIITSVSPNGTTSNNVATNITLGTNNTTLNVTWQNINDIVYSQVKNILNGAGNITITSNDSSKKINIESSGSSSPSVTIPKILYYIVPNNNDGLSDTTIKSSAENNYATWTINSPTVYYTDNSSNSIAVSAVTVTFSSDNNNAVTINNNTKTITAKSNLTSDQTVNITATYSYSISYNINNVSRKLTASSQLTKELIVQSADSAPATTYYWYVGQTLPTSSSDQSSEGWTLLTSKPANGIKIFKESSDWSDVQWYLAAPADWNYVTSFNGTQVGGWTKTTIPINGVSYNVWTAQALTDTVNVTLANI